MARRKKMSNDASVNAVLGRVPGGTAITFLCPCSIRHKVDWPVGVTLGIVISVVDYSQKK